MGITGDEDGPPIKVGVAVTDISTGLYAYGAISAALFHRERTGEGQYIDLALLDSQVRGALVGSVNRTPLSLTHARTGVSTGEHCEQLAQRWRSCKATRHRT